MSVHLRDVTADDLPLIERWLHADHVRRAWGDPDVNLRLLRVPPPEGHWRAILEVEGAAVGLVLWQYRRQADGTLGPNRVEFADLHSRDVAEQEHDRIESLILG